MQMVCKKMFLFANDNVVIIDIDCMCGTMVKVPYIGNHLCDPVIIVRSVYVHFVR